MTYTIQRSNGAILVDLHDRIIDTTTTDLKLVGRAASNYGQPYTENFIFLLENFANNRPPANPLTGQTWYDTRTNNLMVFDSEEWFAVASGKIDPQEIFNTILDGDGPGSRIDADFLDGFHGSEFVLKSDLPPNYNELFDNLGEIGSGEFDVRLFIDIEGGSSYATIYDSDDTEASLNIASQTSLGEKSINFLVGELMSNAVSLDGLHRWKIEVSEEETGNDTGSNLFVKSYDDNGLFKEDAMVFHRETGNIGLGTPTPDADLHIFKTDSVDIVAENHGNGVIMAMSAHETSGKIGTTTNIPVEVIKNDTPIIRIDDANTVHHNHDTYLHDDVRIDGNIEIYDSSLTMRSNVFGRFRASMDANGISLGTITPNNLFLTFDRVPHLTIRSDSAEFRNSVTINGNITATGQDIRFTNDRAKIFLDVNGQRSISTNDGAGDLTLRSGHSIVSGTPRYVVGNSGTANGASAIVLNSDEQNGIISLRVADIGAGNSEVFWNKIVEINRDGMFVDGVRVVLQNELQSGPINADTLDGRDSTAFILRSQAAEILEELVPETFTGSAERLRAFSADQLSSLSVTNNPLTVGRENTLNIALDNQRIQARNNGQYSTIHINPHGGRIELGGPSDDGTVPADTVKVNAELVVQHGMRNESGARINLDNDEVYFRSNATDTLRVTENEITYKGFDLMKLVPPGTVMYFASPYAPEGWTVCDGRELSRTEYSSLFSVIQTMYGSGNGSTTFNVPDLRGEFIRGWDGFLPSSWTPGPNTPIDARGVDFERQIGTNQDHAMERIEGTASYISKSFNDDGEVTGSFSKETGFMSEISNGTSMANTASLHFDSQLTVNTADETRPRNVALMPIIKL